MFNTFPYGYTQVYTCSSPAQQLAAGIIAAIVIGAILVVAGGVFFCRFMRRRRDVRMPSAVADVAVRLYT
jgi:hypothetical protein